MNTMNPNDQLAIRKVVMAGMKVMYDPKTFPEFKQGMLKQMPMPQKLATEAAGLMKLLQDKAQGAIPRQILLPAASMLLLEIAKFMSDAGFGKPTPQDIKAAGQVLLQLMPKAFPKPPVDGQPAAPAVAPAQPQAPPPARGLIQSAQGVA